MSRSVGDIQLTYREWSDLSTPRLEELHTSAGSITSYSEDGMGSIRRLARIARKIFDSDTKLFVKEGILNEDLRLTHEGRDFILENYLMENKKELAKALRKEVKERKKEKDND